MNLAGEPSGRPGLIGPDLAGPALRGGGGGPCHAIGVDVGGTKVLGVALGPDGTVLADARLLVPASLRHPGPPPGAGTPAAALSALSAGETLAQVVSQVVAEVLAGLGPGRGQGTPSGPAGPEARAPIGVGLPGMVDAGGVLCFSPHLPGATGVQVHRALAGRFPAVVVDNDANCAAVAEHVLGAGRGCPNFLLVTLGTGIGGGLVVTGAILRGAHGFAGEIGHLTLDPAGPPCPCGRQGCWERRASGGGLELLAREAVAAGELRRAVELAGGDPGAVRGEHVTRAAEEGDPDALAVVGELGRWVATGLANLVAVLDPERIVLGGGLAEMGELLLGPVRRWFADVVEGAGARPAVEIVEARFGERAGAVGAALLARRRAAGQPGPEPGVQPVSR